MVYKIRIPFVVVDLIALEQFIQFNYEVFLGLGGGKWTKYIENFGITLLLEIENRTWN